MNSFVDVEKKEKYDLIISKVKLPLMLEHQDDYKLTQFIACQNDSSMGIDTIAWWIECIEDATSVSIQGNGRQVPTLIKHPYSPNDETFIALNDETLKYLLDFADEASIEIKVDGARIININAFIVYAKLFYNAVYDNTAYTETVDNALLPFLLLSKFSCPFYTIAKDGRGAAEEFNKMNEEMGEGANGELSDGAIEVLVETVKTGCYAVLLIIVALLVMAIYYYFFSK